MRIDWACWEKILLVNFIYISSFRAVCWRNNPNLFQVCSCLPRGSRFGLTRSAQGATSENSPSQNMVKWREFMVSFRVCKSLCKSQAPQQPGRKAHPLRLDILRVSDAICMTIHCKSDDIHSECSGQPRRMNGGCAVLFSPKPLSPSP